jgi:ABC-2 type transport system ATP-binding protein
VALLVQECDEGRLQIRTLVLRLQLLRRAAEQQLAVGQHEHAVGVALGLADVDATVARMLALTGLGERAGDEVGQLSGGNRQRVNIAVGLLGDPDVLLLDEPTAALDPRRRRALWQTSVDVRDAGGAVLLATQNVEDVDRVADRVAVLLDGVLVFDGSVGEYASSDAAEALA